MATRIVTIERRPRVQSAEPPPLLLMLHGFGSNEHDLMGLSPYIDPRLHIVSARGIYDLEYGAYAWFHLYGTPGNLRADAASSAHGLEVVTKFVATLPERLGADPRRVYLLGFSQGAILSMALAITAPHLVAGIIAISGYLDDAMLAQARPETLADLDVLLLHGVDDDVIPVTGSRRARDYFQTTPARLTYREYPIGHSIHPHAITLIQQWFDERLGAPPAGEKPV